MQESKYFAKGYKINKVLFPHPRPDEILKETIGGLVGIRSGYFKKRLGDMLGYWKICSYNLKDSRWEWKICRVTSLLEQ